MKAGIELEVLTYNRAPIMKQWLEVNFDKAKNLGFACAVYDSSTNDETEELVRFYNNERNAEIKYVRVPSSIRLDEKVLMSILESEYSYVWPIGDSRGFNFDQITNKVVPFFKKNYDFMCIYLDTGKNNDGKTYVSPVDFLDECFWHATLLGGIIFRKDIFTSLLQCDRKERFLKKYNRNDGFSYLGIFYDLIAGERIKASFSVVDIIEFTKNKTPGWLSRYMDVWCGNLVYLIDSLDDVYNPVKSKVLKETWNILLLDGPSWVYKARKKGGISNEILKEYDELGYLDRVTDHKKQMYKYVTFPLPLVKIFIIGARVKRKVVGLLIRK